MENECGLHMQFGILFFDVSAIYYAFYETQHIAKCNHYQIHNLHNYIKINYPKKHAFLYDVRMIEWTTSKT